MPTSISAFAGVRMGMTLETLYEVLGAPDRRHDAGSTTLEYRLDDGSRIDVVYANPKLMRIIHYRLDGTRTSWVPAFDTRRPA